MIRWILRFVFFIVFIELALMYPRVISGPTSAPAQAADIQQNVEQSIGGMHILEAEAGQKEWELWSENAISYKDTGELKLIKVKALFFADNGVTFTVTGQEGKVDVKTKNLFVQGEVLTESSNGYVIKTHDVDYISSEKLLKTKTPVTVNGQGLQLSGVGMEARLKTSSIIIQEDIKAERVMAEDKKVYIQSQSVELSGKTKTARFLGSVVLDVDSMRITGPQADFEYDESKNFFKSVKVRGGTRVTDLDKWAVSENLDIDFAKDMFVFRGSPKVVQNQDELKGEEIVFLENGKRVQVKKARVKVEQSKINQQ